MPEKQSELNLELLLGLGMSCRDACEALESIEQECADQDFAGR